VYAVSLSAIIRREYVEVQMAKKLTITMSDDVYEGLHRVIGPRRIGQFLESLARPHVVRTDLYEAYRAMAADEAREAAAREWIADVPR
jgi:hypothetical protein